MLTTFSQLTTCSLRSRPTGGAPLHCFSQYFRTILLTSFCNFVFSFLALFVHFSCTPPHMTLLNIHCDSLSTGRATRLPLDCHSTDTWTATRLTLGLRGVRVAFAFLFLLKLFQRKKTWACKTFY